MILFVIATVSESVSADDLYRITLKSRREAALLEASGADPLLRMENQFLLLLKGDQKNELLSLGLEVELVANDLDRNHLALDVRRDDLNASLYPVVFDSDGVRLLRVEPSDLSEITVETGLAPLLTGDLSITFKEPYATDWTRSTPSINLDSMTALIDEDSLQSYCEALQAFPSRLTATPEDYIVRDWVVAKFEDFGYEAIELDNFEYDGALVQNVVVYKYGTSLPEHHIIIGAHRDAVADCPGADDNASGTAGVLEIARQLRDFETNMTLIFIVFDAEEQGLFGSVHYANEAAAAGDSIVLMLNMDLVGYEENEKDIGVYNSPDSSYAMLWKYLADSVPSIGLTGHIWGRSRRSDHYPFELKGWDIVYAHEFIVTPHYHSPHDSTVYLDFSYMARVVRGHLATAIWADATYLPVPGLKFSYPEGVPSTLIPGIPRAFQVLVEGTSGGTFVPGTGQLHFSTGGSARTSIPMIDLGNGLCSATIPALVCEDTPVQFLVSADELTVGTLFAPDTANPFVANIASDETVAFEDDFETDKGWSISGGLWARGAPTGNGGDHGGEDPVGGHESSFVLGYNLNGDYENVLPEMHLTSPPIDCSELNGARLEFWRWIGVERPSYDHAYIRVSNDGVNWTTVWENARKVTDTSWQDVGYDISAVADNEQSVYVRFTMGPTDSTWQYCGWNIDDFRVLSYACDNAVDSDNDGVINIDDNCPMDYNPSQEDHDGDAVGDSCDNCMFVFNASQTDTDQDSVGDSCDYTCGDADASDDVDIDDVVYLINHIFSGGPEPVPYMSGDADCSGAVDIDDVVYVIAYVFSGGPEPGDPDGDGIPDC
jgi:hypothetical protein